MDPSPKYNPFESDGWADTDWYVIRDQTGHHRTVMGPSLWPSDEMVGGPYRPYREACRVAEQFNAVKEVMDD